MDGFCLWPSEVRNPHRSDWCSKRDVVGELAEAVRGAGMRFGVYYSGGLDSTFNDWPIGTTADMVRAIPRGAYPAYADAQGRELVRRYRPSVLWNDIAWPGTAERLYSLFAHYYGRVPDGVVNDDFLRRDELLWMLVDIVAKGGNLLLNVGPRGVDAQVPEPQLERLGWLREWFPPVAGALSATRPWVTPGNTTAEGRPVRYTARGDSVFAFVQVGTAGWATLAELASTPTTAVTTLDGAAVDWRDGPAGIEVDFPEAGAGPAVVDLQGVVARPA